MDEIGLLDTKASLPGGSVEIIYYTDPLCCWSWALEPQWRRLRYEYEGQISWRYRLAGMIPGWDRYQDPLNFVSKPQHMGPLWMEAEQVSGMPINSRIWVDDPPESSIPSCLAVKSAFLQSIEAGEAYLRKVREAVMIYGKNIAQKEVLLEVAKDLAAEFTTFDYGLFTKAYASDLCVAALKEDMSNVRTHGVVRFPSLVFLGENKHISMAGYKPYEVLLSALKDVAPDIRPTREVSEVNIYKEYWTGATDRELEEVLHQNIRA